MIIGFDAKRAVSNFTGLGNYSRLVISALAKAHPTDTCLLYTPRLKANDRLREIDGLHNVEYRLPAPQSFKGSLWRTWGIPNHLHADKVNLYHGLSNELPLNIRKADVPSVVTIHDLIFRRCPQFYKPVDRWLYNYKYQASCRNADRIIAVSRRTKEDIVDIYGIDADKIDVVYQGCDDSFRVPIAPETLLETRQRLNLPEKYMLTVGTIEERKNLATLVRTLKLLPDEVKLLAVGRDHHGYQRKVLKTAAEEGVVDRLQIMNNVSFADLPAVYRLARIFIYPSLYEGFGIPILEALESEIPVIAATGSCLEEAGGASSFYTDPLNHKKIAEIAIAILNEEIDIKRHTEQGKIHAAKFNASDMVNSIERTYKKLL